MAGGSMRADALKRRAEVERHKTQTIKNAEAGGGWFGGMSKEDQDSEGDDEGTQKRAPPLPPGQFHSLASVSVVN